MIQRIQTVYLLVAAIVAVVCAVFDGELITRLLAALMAVVALVTIFLYRNRTLQTTLCNVVMCVGIMFYIVLAVKQPDMEWFLALPLVGVLLTFLARKGIVKDEKLVRSLDRIR
jgi:peptidoglycan/LPS O-acetylase OafA/YrhL